MQLKLARSQRQGGVVSKSVVFCLDARIQLTPEEQASVTRYRLGNEVIYNSEASKRHLEAAQQAVQGGSAGGIAKGVASLALVALNLNITINSLQRGQHIECESLSELLDAENALVEACERLRTFLATAATFDGRETLLDFTGDQPAVVSGVAPPSMLAMAPAHETATEASPPPFESFRTANAQSAVVPPMSDGIGNGLHAAGEKASALASAQLARFIEFWRASPLWMKALIAPVVIVVVVAWVRFEIKYL